MQNIGTFIVSSSLEGYNSYKAYILQVQQSAPISVHIHHIVCFIYFVSLYLLQKLLGNNFELHTPVYMSMYLMPTL